MYPLNPPKVPSTIVAVGERGHNMYGGGRKLVWRGIPYGRVDGRIITTTFGHL